MKTTIELSDGLLAEAKKLAAQRGTTLREVLEEGLRHELERAEQGEAAFRLRDGSFAGNGINPEFARQGWSGMRDAIYAGYGS